VSDMICLVLGAVAISQICRAWYSHHLLKTNPQAWRMMNEREDEKNGRRREAMGGAAVKGFKIARFFLKK
jgi:hypothetical protein